jgi:hypothetical protein
LPELAASSPSHPGIPGGWGRRAVAAMDLVLAQKLQGLAGRASLSAKAAEVLLAPASARAGAAGPAPAASKTLGPAIPASPLTGPVKVASVPGKRSAEAPPGATAKKTATTPPRQLPAPAAEEPMPRRRPLPPDSNPPSPARRLVDCRHACASEAIQLLSRPSPGCLALLSGPRHASRRATPSLRRQPPEARCASSLPPPAKPPNSKCPRGSLALCRAGRRRGPRAAHLAPRQAPSSLCPRNTCLTRVAPPISLRCLRPADGMAAALHVDRPAACRLDSRSCPSRRLAMPRCPATVVRSSPRRWPRWELRPLQGGPHRGVARGAGARRDPCGPPGGRGEPRGRPRTGASRQQPPSH